MTKRQAEAVAAGAARFEADKLAMPYETFQGAAASAFRLVAPRENWKLAIDATLQARALDAGYVAAAVTFFTGSVPAVTPVGRTSWRIRAEGYYAAVGA